MRVRSWRSGRVTALVVVMAGGCGPVPPCLEDAHRLAADEPTSLGKSVEAALAGVPLEDMRELHWFESRGVLTFAAGGTDTTVEWSLTPRLDTARFVDARDNPRYTNESSNDCSDRIEVDASLRIFTEDGWLAEPDLDVSITFQQSRGADQATWTAGNDLDVDDLAGRIPFGLSRSEGRDTLHIDGTLGPDGATRIFLSAQSQVESKNAATVGDTDLGCSSSQPGDCEPPL